MLQVFSHWMQVMNGIVWGPPMVLLLIGTGLYLTVRLRGIQLRRFKHGIECISGKYDNPQEQGDISHFQALCAALSATIGTGNIAGVATAIATGGPGAVFWMWVTALVGMATKFTSCSLALRYRVVHADGSASGGPMYYLQRGLGLKWLGLLFALFAGVASLGIGCAVQSNSVVDGLLTVVPQSWQAATFDAGIPLLGGRAIVRLILGIVLAFLVGIVIIGGIRRIAVVAERIVPFMCVAYMLAALAVLAMNLRAIPSAFAQIFHYAFSPVAAGGGFMGVVVASTIEKGVARGVFSNESGLGSAPIAHAAAKTQEMIREGFVAMLGPFIDTIVICTMTALVIITSGVWQVKSDSGELLYGPGGKGMPMTIFSEGKSIQVIGTVVEGPEPFLDGQGRPYELPNGSPLTAAAFESSLPRVGHVLVAFALVFFAYTTMIAWSYYGDRCFEYLLGAKAITSYRYVFCVFAVLGAIGGLDLVWTVADNLNAMMAVPNLIGLLGLSGVVARESEDYIARVIVPQRAPIVSADQ
ncbi:MAG: sodium:alanine symporter family protein [Sedimentisphaerales bacterium]|nr:sodium:alanine symporter family protein [Sedimentisphaerales bacterium]